MTGILGDPQIQTRLKFLRYYLSAPVLHVDRDPIELEVRLLPFWAKIRIAAGVVALAVIAASAYDLRHNGWAGYGEQAPDMFVALVGSLCVFAAITFGAKRLRVVFGPREVAVSEPGVSTWYAPLDSYPGVAWLYYKSESFYRLFQIGNKSEYIRLANPDVTYYHWIELRHPDPAKRLVLAVGPGEGKMGELLVRYSVALKRPIVGTRVEDDGDEKSI